MIKDINFSGFSTNPSDHEAPDGDLACALNLIPEDGALHTINKPRLILAFQSTNLAVLFIHKNDSSTRYIVTDGQKLNLWWCQDSDTPISQDDLHPFASLSSPVKKIQAIGNTLIVLSHSGLNYFLWKNKIQDYIFLGNHLPECNLTFGLQAEMAISDSFTASFDEVSWNDLYNNHDFSDECKHRFSDAVIGNINKFIAEKASEKGKFIFPFFVRYAYRLYDGSLFMHSSPILMPATFSVAPFVLHENNPSGPSSSKVSSFTLRVAAPVFNLDVALANASDNAIDNDLWSDIISSVDVFISSPIFTFDQNATLSPSDAILSPAFYDSQLSKNQAFFYGKASSQMDYQPESETDNLNAYCFHSVSEFFKGFVLQNDNAYSIPSFGIKIPGFDPADYYDKLRSVANFYLIKSLKLSEISSQRSIIDIPGSYLSSLSSREAMSDDYQTHLILQPDFIHTYNSRLHLANVNTIFPQNFNLGAALCFSDFMNMEVKGFVYLNIDGKEIVLGSDNTLQVSRRDRFLWFFYPHPAAFKLVLQINDNSSSKFYEIPMQEHSFLWGAFASVDLSFHPYWVPDNYEKNLNPPLVSDLSQRTVSLPNRLFTSEINNPFFFPVQNIVAIGAGRILALESAARPLSQGQFGQFPLYAFTDEGVWALEISTSGTYSARQPITRDVILNPEAICPIDSAVIFATSRGLMIIQGAQVSTISEKISDNFPFNILSLPNILEILSKNSYQLWEELFHINTQVYPTTTLPYPPSFPSILNNCRITYDYPNQRIFLFNPSFEGGISGKAAFSFVFSLKSKQWAIASLKLNSTVNSYPDAMVMTKNGQLVNLSSSPENIDEILAPQFFVSRPLKLDNPNTLKTVDTFILRGLFRPSAIKTILYASRDLLNWHIVKSSSSHEIRNFSGSPYKYFRIVIIADLKADESISSASFSFSPRFTRLLR
ncbi:MAG: hypothetical protein J1D77_03615 [Muribaculaceae bacterium]|nr:hypothetical protein [Muribaculaceae bacterium]